jgi:type IV fimbrial biogenesis protein FimT
MRLTFQFTTLTTYRVSWRVRGFTLVELMVTISILAIILGIAVPSFLGAIAKNAVAGHVNTFLADARFARTEAIKRGANVTMCRSDNAEAATPTCSTAGTTDWSAGWLIFEDVDNNGAFATAKSDVLIRIQPSLSQSGGMASSVAYNAFTYNAIGKVNTNGTILVKPKGSLSTDTSYQRKLIVDTVGRVRMEKV